MSLALTCRSLLVLWAVFSVSACAGHNPAPVYQGSRWANASAPEPVTQPAPGTITVRRGDTVATIARTYNAPVQDLVAQNDLKAPYTIAAGQKLRLPPPHVHVVAKGDTAYSIAQRYKVPLERLTALNNIDPPFTLRTGQRLWLPYDADFDGRSGTATASLQTPGKGTARPAPKPARSVVVPTEKPMVQSAEYVPAAPALGPERGFIWPVNGRIVSGYGAKADGLHNDGINIAVARGTPVRAAKSGVVTYAGNELKGYGNLLLIKHADGFVTAYAHNEKLLVRRGQEVKQGDIVAEAGISGGLSFSQLHFEIRRGRNVVNPLNYLPGA